MRLKIIGNNAEMEVATPPSTNDEVEIFFSTTKGSILLNVMEQVELLRLLTINLNNAKELKNPKLTNEVIF